MTGIIILCRYNSTRLPGKILKEINGSPLLLYLIERLTDISNEYPIVVCTSEEVTDNPIVEFCKENDIKTYRGSLDNVAFRFKNCALENGFENAVRINGDNLFLDADLILKMIKTHEKGDYKFSSNVKGRTFPKGISVEIVNIGYYEEKYPFFNESDLEHVMTYFYRQDSDTHMYHYGDEKMPSGLNFAIDTEEDFDNALKIINRMEQHHTCYGVEQIIQLNKDLNE